MQLYKAIITGGSLAPDREIIEQYREAMAGVFMEYAVQSAFYYVCRDRVMAERRPYTIDLYRDWEQFAHLEFLVQQEVGAVYADLLLTSIATGRCIVLRRMYITDREEV